jgi:signal recognition particle GTPase
MNRFKVSYYTRRRAPQPRTQFQANQMMLDQMMCSGINMFDDQRGRKIVTVHAATQSDAIETAKRFRDFVELEGVYSTKA